MAHLMWCHYQGNSTNHKTKISFHFTFWLWRKLLKKKYLVVPSEFLGIILHYILLSFTLKTVDIVTDTLLWDVTVCCSGLVDVKGRAKYKKNFKKRNWEKDIHELWERKEITMKIAEGTYIQRGLEGKNWETERKKRKREKQVKMRRDDIDEGEEPQRGGE